MRGTSYKRIIYNSPINNHYPVRKTEWTRQENELRNVMFTLTATGAMRCKFCCLHCSMESK